MNNIIIYQNDSLIFFTKNCRSISHMFVALFPSFCLPFVPLTKKNNQPTKRISCQAAGIGRWSSERFRIGQMVGWVGWNRGGRATFHPRLEPGGDFFGCCVFFWRQNFVSQKVGKTCIFRWFFLFFDFLCFLKHCWFEFVSSCHGCLC